MGHSDGVLVQDTNKTKLSHKKEMVTSLKALALLCHTCSLILRLQSITLVSEKGMVSLLPPSWVVYELQDYCSIDLGVLQDRL